MTRYVFRIAGALALLSTAQLQAAAPTDAKPCITQPEVHGMVAYILPSIVTSVVSRCQATLPPSAAMLSRGPQLATALVGGRVAAFPLARQGFAKFTDQGNKLVTGMLLRMSEVQLRPIMEAAVEQELMSSFKVRDCADIDRVFATLQPLPANNFVDLFTQVIALAARNNKDVSVCAA